jgi:hypothetical protein
VRTLSRGGRRQGAHCCTVLDPCPLLSRTLESNG